MAIVMAKFLAGIAGISEPQPLPHQQQITSCGIAALNLTVADQKSGHTSCLEAQKESQCPLSPGRE